MQILTKTLSSAETPSVEKWHRRKRGKRATTEKPKNRGRVGDDPRALSFPFYPAPTRFISLLSMPQPTGKAKEASAGGGRCKLGNRVLPRSSVRSLFLCNYHAWCSSSCSFASVSSRVFFLWLNTAWNRWPTWTIQASVVRTWALVSWERTIKKEEWESKNVQ